jgi:pyruvate,orthophosphate dikinase
MQEVYKKDSKEFKADKKKYQKYNEAFKKNLQKFLAICNKLEKNYREMQDIEFTIESGVFYILQTRRGQRTAQAAVKIAMDMYKEKLINRNESILMVDPASLDQLLHPIIDPKVKYKDRIITKGMPASPGAAVGIIVFNPDRVEAHVKEDSKAQVILVSDETKPDDIHGMDAAKGILTSRGGKTAHAAVVARGMGKPCIVACSSLQIDFKNRKVKINGSEYKEGDWITIEGSLGEVIKGKLPLIMPKITGDFKTLLKWSDDICKANNGLYVRANADTPKDSRKAREMGALGIGLSRTEHMFMGERTELVAELILVLTKPTELDKNEKRRKSSILKELLRLQFNDFVGIFKAMNGLPVTIRLIDPPLHEFLPEEKEIKERIAKAHHQPGGREAIKHLQSMRKRRGEFHEENPMLGLRGCRLGVRYPEINRMQIEAIFKAAVKVKNSGYKVHPEIMIPLSSTVAELEVLHEMVDEVADEVFKKTDTKVPYLFGTMIEIPRAALVADELANEAQFFSFGTNDLTQMGFGISRDDAEEKFLRYYVDKKILKENPFEKLDRKGIGKLMEIAIERGTSSRPDLKLGICGEHGGEPSSIEYCHKIGLEYVSCNPYRVPIARVAAAHAALNFKRKPPISAKKKSTAKVKSTVAKKVKSKVKKVSPKKKSKK